MVALFDQTQLDQPLVERSHDHDPISRQSLQLVTGGRQGADRPSVPVEESEPPELRLIHGGRSAPQVGPNPVSWVAVVAVACVVLGGLLTIRLIQGGPDVSPTPVAGSVGTAGPATVAGPGDLVVVVAPGDTLWSIAREVAPNRDPRPLVSELTETNGGSALQIGQEIVISARYLD